MAAKQVIRAARPEERQQLSELAMRSKAHWGYDAAFMEACRDELTVRPEDIEARRVTVLERDGKVVGFYGIDGEAPAGELWWLFVEPSAIGSGAGRTLWNHATDGAARIGMTTLRIESDPGAEGFYLAMGAVRVGVTPSLSIPGRTLPLLEYALVREMTDYERAVLDRLLSVEFPGVEAARAQAQIALVWSIDDDGCIEFTKTDGPRIESEHYILAIGDGPRDADGAPIEVMLSTSDGFLWMLEFIRYSGDPSVWPKPEEWTISWTFPDVPRDS